jgi:hypothetical protein
MYNGTYTYTTNVNSKEVQYKHNDIGGNYKWYVGNTTARMSLSNSGSLIVSGDVTAYGSPSDMRLKENVATITHALDKVRSLNGYTYNYIGKEDRLTGLSAQELQEVLPEAVYKTTPDPNTSEEFLAIRYGNVVGLLVEAIKEQQKQIDLLKEKIGD